MLYSACMAILQVAAQNCLICNTCIIMSMYSLKFQYVAKHLTHLKKLLSHVHSKNIYTLGQRRLDTNLGAGQRSKKACWQFSSDCTTVSLIEVACNSSPTPLDIMQTINMMQEMHKLVKVASNLVGCIYNLVTKYVNYRVDFSISSARTPRLEHGSVLSTLEVACLLRATTLTVFSSSYLSLCLPFQ